MTNDKPEPSRPTASPTCYMDEFPEYFGLDDIKQKRTPAMPLIPESTNVFTIDLEYTAPLEQIDNLRDAHIEFLNKYYAAGTFLVSGPKVPRIGGVIIAVADSRERVEEIIREDAFHKAGVANYTITEFFPGMKAEGLG